jgi:dephospho-CoA kinase
LKFIGITGGVGSGKSEILAYLSQKPGVKVMLADEIAHELMQPDGACYKAICEQFAGEDILREDGAFDRMKLANVIFSDPKKREQMNGIVHPAVKAYIEEVCQNERKKGELSVLILEAALLIEEHYDEICDQLWYIAVDKEIRAQRLAASRGYSDEKIQAIFQSQLDEETYRKSCAVVIDNNNTREETFRQVDLAMQQIQ